MILIKIEQTRIKSYQLNPDTLLMFIKLKNKIAMSNTKHTPGPWRLTHTTPSWGRSHQYVIWAEMPYQILQSGVGKSTPIGSIDMNDSYGHVWQFPTDAEGEMIKDESFNRSELPAEANAKLIAAAPELLEALKECEEYFDDVADVDYDETEALPNKEMQLLVIVRKAIQNAENQTP